MQQLRVNTKILDRLFCSSQASGDPEEIFASVLSACPKITQHCIAVDHLVGHGQFGQIDVSDD